MMSPENSNIYQIVTKKVASALRLACEIQTTIDYKFQNMDLLFEAVIHSSGAQEQFRKYGTNLPWNERLEFLGDSILGLVLSNELLNRPESYAEGQLSKIRASLVNEDSLAQLASQIDLGRYLILSVGEERSGGRRKKSVLADALEALLELSIWMEATKPLSEWYWTCFKKKLSAPLTALVKEDYKSRLQELTQSSFKETPNYEVVEKSGPDHKLSFVVAVNFRGSRLAIGQGPNKKKASQEAAKQALGLAKDNPNFLTEGIT